MLKVALVGCGRISARHVDAILDNKDLVEIACVCDKKEDRAKALAEKLGCEYVTNYLDLTGRGIDSVSVLTPPESGRTRTANSEGLNPESVETCA